MNKIGIIGAMEEEVALLLEKIELEEKVDKAGLEFYVGKLRGKDVIVVKCGVGKVNSAMCTQILISEFGAEALVNIGVAGALNDELDVNDIVISTDAIEYDMDASAFGDPKGTIPRMDCSEFKADERLINAAFDAAVKENKGHNVMKGRIATGDLFVADMETKNELVNDFGGFCCEMEGAAMAHVCYLNKAPYVIIRAMSDKADGSADVTFEEFSKKAAVTSANIVMDMLEMI